MTDIARERRLLKEQGLVMRTREEWGAKFDYTNDRACDVAHDFFLHVAVVKDPGDLQATEDQVARNIESIGINRFPNTGISYNAMAFNTGKLSEGQPLTRRGAHTVNDYKRSTCLAHGGSLLTPYSGDAKYNLNITVRAICLPQMVGDPVTAKQVDSIARWGAAQVRSGLAIETARWHGHRDVTNKDCPGSAGYSLIPTINNLMRKYIENGLQEEEEMTPAQMQELKNYIDAAVAKGAKAAAKAVWDEQIPDVLSAESGDTIAARTHLTWMPKRVSDQIKA